MVSLVLAASLYRSQDSHSVLVYLGKQLPSPSLKSVSHLRRTEGRRFPRFSIFQLSFNLPRGPSVVLHLSFLAPARGHWGDCGELSLLL
jgi:hypothetical protein